MSELNIGIIGCGNMGSTIARGLISRRTADPVKLRVHDADHAKAKALSSDLNCRDEELKGVINGSDVVIIAVKPGDFGSLAGEMAAYWVDQLLISVMAGMRNDDIADMLGVDAGIVRAMPNMAALVGRSVTCIAANSFVCKKEIETAKLIFSCIGEVVEVSETHMDAVTAVSGSGPAYLFFLAEAMMVSAEKNGLSPEISRKLVVETLYGASALMKGAESSPSELISKVASKGGTTEAALSVFRERSLSSIVHDAVTKAAERSREISERR